MNRTVLKWAGSKARIAEKLREHLPIGDRLVEPFGGSCAVMMNTDYPAYLVADINPDLINLYKAVAQEPERFIADARVLFEQNNTAPQYCDIRLSFNLRSEDDWGRACQFLYLNRHCFNGLCRYNRAGHFNVPFGKYKSPYFPEAEIRAFAEKAGRAIFLCANYLETLALVKPGDVVYCDPPYLTEAGNFTAYHTQGFNHEAHGKLARRLRRIAADGVPVVASNSDIPTVRHLFRGFDFEQITAPRSLGAMATSQKTAAELIIKSVPAASCGVAA